VHAALPPGPALTMRKRSLLALLWLALSSGSLLAAQETVRLVFVGDMMLAEAPGTFIRRGGDPVQPFAAIFGRADLRIGNLECAIGNTGQAEDKPFTFRAHPRVIGMLKKHFNAVSLANNHSADFGMAAFEDMLGLLERQQTGYFGGGRDMRAAHRPYIADVRGRRVAILGYNDIFPRSFEALSDRPGVAWADEDRIRHDIAQARARDQADIVIVYPHWGWEHQKHASARQQALARLMVDAGADAVVGSHPHVTQNIELYRGKPIFYSLGNFIFNGFADRQANTGWVLELEFDPAGTARWTLHVARLDQRGLPRYGGVAPQ
jgi:poly-gamma-glutamate synthesis protein (capsule biosynthesis protein)